MNESISELQNIWERVKEELRKTVDDARFFDVFLTDSSVYSLNNNTLTVVVNSGFAATILGTKYSDVIKEAVSKVYGTDLKITFESKDDLKEHNSPSLEERPQFFKNSITSSTLTFDNFVTGQSNLEAKQAALYIASNPGKAFNPLFIYSNPGLGKTHLLHAIVNHVKEQYPGKRCLYCETSDFFQEYINYVTGEKQQDALKKFITSFDVFLIDDIQGLATKEKTAMFFFDIFNLMYSHNKQIVITSDKHPSELKGFEERLKSRFASGLTVSINQPDYSTCVEIVKSKINNSPLNIDSFDTEVIELIAKKFSKNIRDIDSALNKLLWYVTSFKPTNYIAMDTATEALQSLIDVKEAKTKLTEQRIINAVGDYYGLTPSELIGPSRQGTVALARHIAMYLIKKLLDTPYTRIGILFGGKDHSTVMSGVEKVENSLKTNTSIQQVISDLKGQLKA